ncbi:hypothetical protein PENTCL1PPCAC_23969, partial [Pristionchus entomophagus]
MVGHTFVCMIWFFSSTLISRTIASEKCTSIGGEVALGTGRTSELYLEKRSTSSFSSSSEAAESRKRTDAMMKFPRGSI